jgi:Flp pilus assembly protein CpaB
MLKDREGNQTMTVVHQPCWAAGLLLVAAGMVFSQPAPGDDELIPVLIAKKPLKGLTRIDKASDLFEVQMKRKSSVPKTALSSLDDKKLTNVRLNKPIPQGSCVTPDDLISADLFGGRQVPKNRAVPIEVDLTGLPAGSVVVGSRVDVLYLGDKKQVVLLEKVPVVAIEEKPRDKNDLRSQRHFKVTLDVSPEQAQRLALARALEVELSLAVHSPAGKR